MPPRQGQPHASRLATRWISVRHWLANAPSRRIEDILTAEKLLVEFVELPPEIILNIMER